MQTHQIHVSGAGESVHEIRCELFAFPEVLDVFVTGRPDVLVVVYTGRPRAAEWLLALREVGYHTTTRDHATWGGRDRPPTLLRSVGKRPEPGADYGDRATDSMRKEQAPRRRRHAA